MPSKDFIQALQRLYVHFQQSGGRRLPACCSQLGLLDDDLTEWYVQLRYRSTRDGAGTSVAAAMPALEEEEEEDFFILLRLRFVERVGQDSARGQAGPATATAAAAAAGRGMLGMPLVFIVSPRLTAPFIHAGAICSLELMSAPQWALDPSLGLELLLLCLHDTLNPFTEGSRVQMLHADAVVVPDGAAGSTPKGYSTEEHEEGLRFIQRAHPHLFRPPSHPPRDLLGDGADGGSAAPPVRLVDADGARSHDAPQSRAVQTADELAHWLLRGDAGPAQQSSGCRFHAMVEEDAIVRSLAASESSRTQESPTGVYVRAGLPWQDRHARLTAVSVYVPPASSSRPLQASMMSAAFSQQTASTTAPTVSPRQITLVLRQRSVAKPSNRHACHATVAENEAVDSDAETVEECVVPAGCCLQFTGFTLCGHVRVLGELVLTECTFIGSFVVEGTGHLRLYGCALGIWVDRQLLRYVRPRRQHGTRSVEDDELGSCASSSVARTEGLLILDSAFVEIADSSVVSRAELVDLHSAADTYDGSDSEDAEAESRRREDFGAGVSDESSPSSGTSATPPRTASLPPASQRVDAEHPHTREARLYAAVAADLGLSAEDATRLQRRRARRRMQEAEAAAPHAPTETQQQPRARPHFSVRHSPTPSPPPVPRRLHRRRHESPTVAAAEEEELPLLRAMVTLSNTARLHVADSVVSVGPGARCARAVYAEHHALVAMSRSVVAAGRLGAVNVQSGEGHFERVRVTSAEVVMAALRGTDFSHDDAVLPPAPHVGDRCRSTGLNVELGGVMTARECVAAYVYFGFSAVAQSVANLDGCHAQHIVNGFTIDGSRATLTRCSAAASQAGLYALHKAKCVLLEESADAWSPCTGNSSPHDRAPAAAAVAAATAPTGEAGASCSTGVSRHGQGCGYDERCALLCRHYGRPLPLALTRVVGADGRHEAGAAAASDTPPPSARAAGTAPQSLASVGSSPDDSVDGCAQGERRRRASGVSVAVQQFLHACAGGGVDDVLRSESEAAQAMAPVCWREQFVQIVMQRVAVTSPIARAARLSFCCFIGAVYGVEVNDAVLHATGVVLADAVNSQLWACEHSDVTLRECILWSSGGSQPLRAASRSSPASPASVSATATPLAASAKTGCRGGSRGEGSGGTDRGEYDGGGAGVEEQQQERTEDVGCDQSSKSPTGSAGPTRYDVTRESSRGQRATCGASLASGTAVSIHRCLSVGAAVGYRLDAVAATAVLSECMAADAQFGYLVGQSALRAVNCGADAVMCGFLACEHSAVELSCEPAYSAAAAARSCDGTIGVERLSPRRPIAGGCFYATYGARSRGIECWSSTLTGDGLVVLRGGDVGVHVKVNCSVVLRRCLIDFSPKDAASHFGYPVRAPWCEDAALLPLLSSEPSAALLHTRDIAAAGVSIWADSRCRLEEVCVRYARCAFVTAGPQAVLHARGAVAQHCFVGCAVRDAAAVDLAHGELQADYGVIMEPSGRCTLTGGVLRAREVGVDNQSGLLTLRSHVKILGPATVGMWLRDGAHVETTAVSDEEEEEEAEEEDTAGCLAAAAEKQADAAAGCDVLSKGVSAARRMRASAEDRVPLEIALSSPVSASLSRGLAAQSSTLGATTAAAAGTRRCCISMHGACNADLHGCVLRGCSPTGGSGSERCGLRASGRARAHLVNCRIDSAGGAVCVSVGAGSRVVMRGCVLSVDGVPARTAAQESAMMNGDDHQALQHHSQQPSVPAHTQPGSSLDCTPPSPPPRPPPLAIEAHSGARCVVDGVTLGGRAVRLRSSADRASLSALFFALRTHWRCWRDRPPRGVEEIDGEPRIATAAARAQVRLDERAPADAAAGGQWWSPAYVLAATCMVGATALLGRKLITERISHG